MMRTVTRLPKDARIRVLWLIKGLGAGGAERLLVSLAEVADHERFAYEAAYVRPDKDTHVPDLAGHGVPSFLLGQEPGGRWRWPVRLRRLLIDRGYDIVHAHSPLLAAVARVEARSIVRGPVTVSTEHNEWPSFVLPTRFANALTAPLDKHRWSVSPRVRDTMWRPLRREVDVLVHGLPPSRYAAVDRGRRADIRRSLGLTGDAVVCLTVANLRPEKAYPVLFEAARAALPRDDRLVFLCVGQGPLADELAGLHRELGLGNRVRLLGYRDDVPDLMAAADVFVLSSNHEGYPIALMEALAAGLPVVATRVGGVPEAVQEGRVGLLVDPGQPSELAEAVLQLAGDATRRLTMARAARDRGRSYDISGACRTLEAAYRSFVDARPADPDVPES
jgi:glycosyltransferase involved in cell wall biosynthesis